ncbi:MAG: cytochrome c peroxidase, partial [Bradyrhizobium sp.]
MLNRTIVWFLGAGLVAGAVFAAEPQTLPGENPHPIHLIRRPVEPFSAMAKLGHDVFFDTSLSSSGKIACASCHSPDHAYGPPNDGPVMLGGPALTLPGLRAVPSLTYLERQLDFSIGPEKEDENDNVAPLAQQAEIGKTAVRAEKIATQTAQ